MDIVKVKAQYEEWKADMEIEEPSEDLLWAFLSEYGLLKDDSNVPADAHKPISVLSVTLHTDGDFRCDLNHPKLAYDDYQCYHFFVSWSDEKIAVKEALEILCSMKKYTTAEDDKYMQELLDNLFDEAIYDIRNYGSTERCISGNYEGTRILFQKG